MTIHNEVPSSGPAFEAMMQAIDAKLKADGVDISSRPILAGSEVSRQYQIAIPVVPTDSSRLPLKIRMYAPMTQAIHQWYENNYGDRLHVDMCPGRTAVLLDDDLYVMRVPRVFGAAQFITSRAFISQPSITRGGPATCNILQTIESLTPAKAASLSDQALLEATTAFDRALQAVYTLEGTPHELIKIAQGDITTAVQALMDKRGRFGESKWASLQAGEKVLKAAITLQGGKFSSTHNLAKLSSELRGVGIELNAPELLQVMQCSAKIRYGEESCSRNDALAAHHASLALVNKLRAEGAKFVSGINGRGSAKV